MGFVLSYTGKSPAIFLSLRIEGTSLLAPASRENHRYRRWQQTPLTHTESSIMEQLLSSFERVRDLIGEGGLTLIRNEAFLSSPQLYGCSIRVVINRVCLKLWLSTNDNAFHDRILSRNRSCFGRPIWKVKTEELPIMPGNFSSVHFRMSR